MSRRSAKSPVKFSQWTRLTPDIINRFLLPDTDEQRLTLDDLQNMGVIEYISADEQENMYLAQNLGELRANRHNVCARYTHCDIEQAIHGMVILSAPLADHSYGIRTTYFGNQRKQSAAWYDLAWPYRCDKKTMVQYYCEHPIVSTFADHHTYPNGQNCVVAFMIHGGFNQEDSVYINADAIQRGLCNGLFFDYETAICEAGEVFTMPDQSVVVDRHSNAVTDYLENGVARVGSIVKRDYVLINKVAVSPDASGESRRSGRDGTRVVDRSIIYARRTPARILSVVRGEDDHKMQFIRVRYCQVKDAITGDKMSSRQGNKGIIARIIPACDMPITESGLIPDIIVNPQSIPTRRALNQLIEMVCGNDAALEGFYMDATNSMRVDTMKIIERLKANGMPNIGYERMYNGITGDWLTPAFVGICTYQRLEKFVDNECRAIRYGPIDPLTHQPARGGVEKGALRMGEMELWTLLGHGAMRSLAEKIITDSDGTTTYICSRCGSVAIYNPIEGLYNCKKCEQFARIVSIPTTWSANIVRDEIRTLGVHMQYELEPHKFYVDDT
jgi:DNA-directed RNA polymerase beta subunit